MTEKEKIRMLLKMRNKIASMGMDYKCSCTFVENRLTDPNVAKTFDALREALEGQLRKQSNLIYKTMTTTLYNYTPHSITLNSGEKYDSVGVARVSNTFSEVDENGICSVSYGDITGLPEPKDGCIYIVSALVLAAAKAAGRTDCVAPATGHPDCLRKDGFIISVPCFVR